MFVGKHGATDRDALACKHLEKVNMWSCRSSPLQPAHVQVGTFHYLALGKTRKTLGIEAWRIVISQCSIQLSRDGGKGARMTEPMGHVGHNNDKDGKTREGERIVVCAEVVLRRTGQKNYRVNAYDISRHGCKVEFIERPKDDECVWVKFDGIEPIEASVRWTRDFTVGLQFQHAIHPAVFALLLDRLSE